MLAVRHSLTKENESCPTHSFLAQQANNNSYGDICYYSTLCWRGTTSTHPFAECMAGWEWRDFLCCGQSGSPGQLPPLSEAALISDIYPVPPSRICWKSQLSVRLDNTCNFQSGFSANINQRRASQHRRLPKTYAFMKPPHCDVETAFHMRPIFTSASSQFCGISLEMRHPSYLHRHWIVMEFGVVCCSKGKSANELFLCGN